MDTVLGSGMRKSDISVTCSEEFRFVVTIKVQLC